MRARRRVISIAAVVSVLWGSSAGAATITVSTVADTGATDGACSLREAITNANANDQSGSVDCAAGAGADTIVFAAPLQGGTITLVASLPSFTDTARTTIDGTGRAIVVSGNSASRVFAVNAGAVVELRELTITAGKAFSPGGGAVLDSGALTVVRCTFSNNDATIGGAIRTQGAATLSVVDSTFSANTSGNGSMMFCGSSGTVDIRGSTFVGNGAANCGVAAQTGTTTITNSTFFGNTSGPGYSGAALCGLGGVLDVVSSTFAANVAATLNGGTIYQTGATVTFRNSIVVGGGTTAPCSATLIDGGGNIDEGTSCGFTSASGSFPSTPAGLDPAGPKDNGGPTQTIALLPGSNAIDRGVAAACAAAPVSGVDQRGVKRPLDGDGDGTATCDIGAFEMRAKNGGACSADTECVSAHCVDAVCCDTTCGGGDTMDCQACSIAAGTTVAGVCGPVTNGRACASGTCSGGSCVPPDAGPPDTAMADTAMADTAMADTAMADTATADARADDTAPMDTGAADAGQIDSGSTDVGLDVMSQDPSKTPIVEGNARSCTTSAECSSGFCVDHVCCNEACEGPCRSCALPQAPGICALQPLGYDLRSACSSDKPCYSTCGTSGACVPSFPGARCANNRCTGPSTGRGAAVCSALAGACQHDQAIAFDCAPYACAPAFGACLRDCVSSDECAPGYVCDVPSKRCVGANDAEDTGGCAYRGRDAGALGGLALALAVLGRARRRRV